ncbi:MAG: DUF2788 domain-containing protein [Gammaproteobacteria bacterium]|jgi:hypothetical protein|nr:DUF2788 domain-containing protein [Gammaproteobacteria bacterium]MBT3722460.1 DUF2788 domain-containing protein [Gammaproteobacteria bacterium]MBT4077813.1 DUF2788 domain-containing protein [Gammaproteobacteria bacterium]MBT4196527.1 DUF2788 domain-containing protein [Gammaproteobacteria bacterium]MBT4450213.1 DUF2788 domain-containing protein [Gammaproteobacteria bacterium]
MNEKEFAEISLNVGLVIGISYMVFIIYKLGKDSKAGKFGGFILFLALGLGIFGFIVKFIIKMFLTSQLS